MRVEERTVDVRKTARYLIQHQDGPIREVWFLLHGYGQLASEFLSSCHALSGPGRLLVAPEGLSRFYQKDFQRVGASWMTREGREAEIADYVAFLDSVHDLLAAELEISGASIHVLGFSQGSATASRWVASGKFGSQAHLVCWGGDLAHDISEPGQAFRGVCITLVMGERDHLITPERRQAFLDRMREWGLPFDLLMFDGGHRMDDETLRQVAADPFRGIGKPV